jgi:opacity protein-like surface antigen
MITGGRCRLAGGRRASRAVPMEIPQFLAPQATGTPLADLLISTTSALRRLHPGCGSERRSVMSRPIVLRSGLLLVLAVVLSLPAAAQTQSDHRWYVVGFGGLGATEVTSPYFGGGGGFSVTNDLQITVEIGRMQDALADFTSDDLAIVDEEFTAVTGIPMQSAVKMPTNLVLAGVRYLMPLRGVARPYVSAAGGIAHMSPKATFVIGGIDVTSVMYEDELIQSTFREDTRPTVAVGGGVAADLTRNVTVDVGYEFSGIFIDTDYLQDFEVSPHSHSRLYNHRVLFGLGLKF